VNTHELFFALVGLHFLCDYPLQGDFLAVGKGSFAKPHFGVPWWHCLTAHAAIHGLAVGAITGSLWLGLAETAAHFIIDWAKCKKLTGINVDQGFHILCKAAWVLFVASNGVPQ
jgi:hypothetical protein